MARLAARLATNDQNRTGVNAAGFAAQLAGGSRALLVLAQQTLALLPCVSRELGPQPQQTARVDDWPREHGTGVKRAKLFTQLIQQLLPA